MLVRGEPASFMVTVGLPLFASPVRVEMVGNPPTLLCRLVYLPPCHLSAALRVPAAFALHATCRYVPAALAQAFEPLVPHLHVIIAQELAELAGMPREGMRR